MPLSSDQPLREVTPEERKRTARTLGLILLAFVGGIALMVMVMSVQGRAAREYGQLVLQAAQKADPTLKQSEGAPRPCAEFLPGKVVPPTVQSCVLEVKDGKGFVTLKVEGDRQYIVR